MFVDPTTSLHGHQPIKSDTLPFGLQLTEMLFHVKFQAKEMK